MNEKDVECKGRDRTERSGYNVHVVIHGVYIRLEERKWAILDWLR